MSDVFDPVYYIPHILFFVWGAVCLGAFLRMLCADTADTGWRVTPRKVYLITLCASTFVYVLLQIDPYTALGIYTIQWQNFLAWFSTSLLIGAVCAALYLFSVVLYVQHHLEVPVWLTRSYFLANVLANTIVFTTSMAAAITNNQFWFSITGWMIVIQELVIAFGHTASLTKVDRVLKDLEKNGFDYKPQRRKLLVFRVATLILCLASIVNQMIGIHSPLLLTYGVPLEELDLRTFDISVIAGDFLALVAMSVLWYIFRRPSSSTSASKANSHRLDASKASITLSRLDI